MIVIREPLLQLKRVQDKSDPDPELLDLAHSVPSWCRRLAACPPGPHRAELCPDEAFENLFPSGTGRPSVLAQVIASAMVLKETPTGGRERRRDGHRQGPEGLARRRSSTASARVHRGDPQRRLGDHAGSSRDCRR